MMKSREQEILDRISLGYSLPSLSPVAMRLVRLASVENITLDDLSGVIEKDPALTVRLLRLANSAFFCASGPVTTISQSISVMGLNRLRIMALSLSLRDTFPLGKVGPLDYEEFWKISLYQALIAKALASRLRTCKPDEAFIGGLTLEVGILIFYDLLIKGSKNVPDIHLQPLNSLIEWEEEKFGINHRQVGAAVLKYWGFPDNIIECQRYHNIGTGAVKPPELAFVCDISREFAALIRQKSLQWQSSFSKVEAIYHLEYEALSDILVSVFEECREIAASFRVEMNKKQDILTLMEKANSALSALFEKVANMDGLGGVNVLRGYSSSGMKEVAIGEAMQEIAHEIRNPLTVIGGFAGKLEKKLDPQSEEWQYVKIIVEESRRLESTIDHLTGKGVK
jgi:HD-like signal output (HDOD) protein